MPETDNDGYVEVTFPDGASARWSVTETEADDIAKLIEDRIGPPDTIKA
jgi:hypothetical protein